MNKILDCRVDAVFNQETGEFEVEVHVWDGDIFVASKRFAHAVFWRAWDNVKPFLLYWSGLYFDDPSLTPDFEHESGLTQLQLGL